MSAFYIAIMRLEFNQYALRALTMIYNVLMVIFIVFINSGLTLAMESGDTKSSGKARKLNKMGLIQLLTFWIFRLMVIQSLILNQ